MSEEDQGPVELAFGFVGQAESPVRIEFLNGIATVPDFVVQGIGGPTELEKIADALRDITFADFMDGFRATIHKRELNEWQRRFVANHFTGLGPGF